MFLQPYHDWIKDGHDAIIMVTLEWLDTDSG